MNHGPLPPEAHMGQTCWK